MTKPVFINSRFDPTWISRITHLITAIKPDLVMTHGFNGHFTALAVSKLYGHRIPLICSYHGSYHAPTANRKFLESLFNNFTELYIRFFAKACVVVSEHSKNYLMSKGITADKITVIHNGIEKIRTPTSIRDKIRAEFGILPDEILIGAASRIDPVKGIQFLIDAFHKLSSAYPKVKLLIVGSGTIESEIKNSVYTLGLEKRILFSGYRDDVPNCLSAIDIFVLPSLAEYHSIALLEAMRAGKCIIATNVGGNPESVRDQFEGLIIPPADSDAIARAITKVLLDNVLFSSLGKAARLRFINEFTNDKMVSRTADWLTNMYNKHSHKP